MHFSQADALEFMFLQRLLLWFANERLGVLPHVEGAGEWDDSWSTGTHLEDLAPVRDAFGYDPALIDEFLAQGPVRLSREAKETVSSWRHGFGDRFYVVRHRPTDSIFLSASDPQSLYAVGSPIYCLAECLEELPAVLDAWLLPFKGRIVFDGILKIHVPGSGVSLPPNLDEMYDDAESREGIVIALARDPSEAKARPSKTKPRRKRPTKRSESSTDAKSRLAEITALTDAICDEKLSDEYRDLCRKVGEKLSRKRPSPLTRGKAATWAAGILRTVAWSNGLRGPGVKKWRLTSKGIDEELGVREGTSQQKSKEIRQMLRIRRFDTEWQLPSQQRPEPLLELEYFMKLCSH